MTAGSDAFSLAPAIALGETTALQSNAGLTLEAGEPTPPGYEGGFHFRTAWWYYEPSSPGWVKADSALCDDSDYAVLIVYACSAESPSLSGLVHLLEEDWSPRGAWFYAHTGYRYYFQLGVWEDVDVDYSLRFVAAPEGPPAPTFDEVAASHGTLPEAGSSYITAPTVTGGQRNLATNAAFASSSGAGDGEYPGVTHRQWWKVVPEVSGLLRFFGQGGRVANHIYDADLHLMAMEYSTGSSSPMCFAPVEAGDTYYVMMGRTDGATAFTGASIAVISSTVVEIPCTSVTPVDYGPDEITFPWPRTLGDTDGPNSLEEFDDLLTITVYGQPETGGTPRHRGVSWDAVFPPTILDARPILDVCVAAAFQLVGGNSTLLNRYGLDFLRSPQGTSALGIGPYTMGSPTITHIRRSTCRSAFNAPVMDKAGIEAGISWSGDGSDPAGFRDAWGHAPEVMTQYGYLAFEAYQYQATIPEPPDVPIIIPPEIDGVLGDSRRRFSAR